VPRARLLSLGFPASAAADHRAHRYRRHRSPSPSRRYRRVCGLPRLVSDPRIRDVVMCRLVMMRESGMMVAARQAATADRTATSGVILLRPGRLPESMR
jgi:hypothetical protein